MNDYEMKIILGIISILGALITGFLIPWLKVKIGNEKLKEYMFWVNKAVECAQQLYTPDLWNIKKNFVLEFINDKYGKTLTESEIKVLHEAAVKELKLAESEVNK